MQSKQSTSELHSIPSWFYEFYCLVNSHLVYFYGSPIIHLSDIF